MRRICLLALAALGACGKAAEQRHEGTPAAAATAREGFALTPDSVRLYYRVVGSGAETVILNAANYHQQAFDALVTPNRQVVLYDIRGRGKTDSVPPSKMGIAEFDASDIDVIRQVVGAEKVALVGWSGGALSMFRYAADHPDRVTHLIFLTPVGPRWDPWWEGMRKNAGAKADTAANRALAERVKAGEFATDEAALCRESAKIGLKTNWVVTSRIDLAPDVCDSPNEVPSRYGDFVPRLLAKLGHYDWRADFAKVTARRLVIHGEFDNPPLDGSREWVAGVPEARLLVIKGVGHWPHYEKPEETLAAIRTFLDGGWPAEAIAVPTAP